MCLTNLFVEFLKKKKKTYLLIFFLNNLIVRGFRGRLVRDF